MSKEEGWGLVHDTLVWKNIHKMCVCVYVLKRTRRLISKSQVIVTANTAPAPEKLIVLVISASGLCEFSPGYSNQAHTCTHVSPGVFLGLGN